MKIIKLFPGIVLSIAIATLACWLESLLPIHLIGSAVIAMFIGMFLNQFIRKTYMSSAGSHSPHAGAKGVCSARNCLPAMPQL